MSNLNFVNGRGMSSAQWNEIVSKTNQAIRSYKQFDSMDKNEIAVEGYFKLINSSMSWEEFGTKLFWGYFFTIVKNIAIDKVRKMKRYHGYFKEIDDSVELYIHHDSLSNNEEFKYEQLETVKGAMEELSERERLLLINKYQNNWSNEDIAEHFGYKNANCAGNYVKRAKDNLNRILRKLKES
jgi:RNA polymerase sigma factor (sigma-70 family)